MAEFAFLGAGAVGAPAALMAARLMPEAKITVLDANIRPQSAARTFVLHCSTVTSWQDHDWWDVIAAHTHQLTSMHNEFEGCFGALRLAGSDCDADAIGVSVDEGDFLHALRLELQAQSNVDYINSAEVIRISPLGKVTWLHEGQERSANFNAVAIAGLPEKIMQAAGFTFTTHNYNHVAVVSTFDAPNAGNEVHERLIKLGATTTVPRKKGWGHILITSAQAAQQVLEIPENNFGELLFTRSYAPHIAASTLCTRGKFAPRLRLAKATSIGKVVLLGATACTVHPVGAQELNLGLRDALAYAQALRSIFATKGTKGDWEQNATSFAASRKQDRRRITQLTDMAARFIFLATPGKLKLCGLAATALDLCPTARRMILSNAVMS